MKQTRIRALPKARIDVMHASTRSDMWVLTPEQPEATRLGEVLGKVAEGFGKEKSSLETLLVIVREWEAIAGQHCAHARPGKLDQETGCLHVLAQSTRHASVIRWESTAMLQRIAERVGEGVVTSIQVIAPL